MSDYEPGKMDIEDQKRTYNGFITGTKWLAGISIFVLVFLAVFNS